MDMDKEEIERSIAHQRKMLRTLRSRLEQRELQEAQQGINSPPEVINEIHDLTERIQRHEAEIARLQTEAAVDKESLAEVQYIALLAEAWNTPRGLPNTIGRTQLDLARLRLGIARDRGRELARKIRVSLAEEAFSQVHSDAFQIIASQHVEENHEKLGQVLVIIGRAIRLHPKVAAQLFLRGLSPELSIDLNYLRAILLKENNVWLSQRDAARFDEFLTELAALMAHQQSAE